MRKFFLTAFATMLTVSMMAGITSTFANETKAEKGKKKHQVAELKFDASNSEAGSLVTPHGKMVKYTAYTNLYYVTNIEDSTYQYLNVFVPEGATQQTPIFMPNYVGGYMASAPKYPDAGDASGRALEEGYVVVIPGARGRNSVVTDISVPRKTGEAKKGVIGNKTYTGRAPKAILDLKAAVRYLRKFDALIPGDAEKIITDGTSAGGAMSALLGATANDPVYEPYLKAMGAADTKDNIFAAVCFCPIIDLDHADMCYEWLYGSTNADARLNTADLKRVSNDLKGQFADYIRSLNLKKEDGTALTADNYLDYIKQLIISSAQDAKDAGADIPDSIGFKFSASAGFAAPVNGGKKMNRGGGPGKDGLPADMPEEIKKMRRNSKPRPGDGIVDLDMPTYLNYVASTIALKPCPSFDNKGVAGNNGTGENEEFGDATGSSINFTDYALQQATGNPEAKIDAETAEHVMMLNPMPFIVEGNENVAPHWYIRHGARDRDTSFPVPVNLATKLQNCGADVNFKLPWNRPHSGDYALNELFRWIAEIVK